MDPSSSISDPLQLPVVVDKEAGVHYKLIKSIGQGGFAEVFEAQDEQDNKVYALKQLRKLKDSLVEVELHTKLNHCNIVRAFNFFSYDFFFYLKMDFCDYGTLSKMVGSRKGITEVESKYYIKQLLSALSYLHRLNIAHRDVKLSNLLLDSNMNLKLADFGVSTYIPANLDDDSKSTFCGTDEYMSPEILYEQGHGLKTDLWSAGVVLFKMMNNRAPFPVLADAPPKRGSQFCQDLVRRLLTVVPDARISTVDALNHPFFRFSLPETIPPRAIIERPSYHDLYPSM